MYGLGKQITSHVLAVSYGSVLLNVAGAVAFQQVSMSVFMFNILYYTTTCISFIQYCNALKKSRREILGTLKFLICKNVRSILRMRTIYLKGESQKPN